MKTHQLTLTTLLLSFFLTSISKAQIIDSLKIIPSNPTTIDTVKVICYDFRPTGGCSIAFGPNKSIIDTLINIATYLQLDSFAAACNFNDTFSLGIFTPDNYQVDYNLSDGWGNLHFKSIAFTVTPSIAINNSIDSIAILPPNPTTTDTVKVISYTSFGYTPCSLANPSFNIVDTNITVYTSYTTGIAPTLCTSIDTLTIGKLNVGNYELTFHLADTAPPTTYDIDTIIFTVQQPSGLQPTEYSEQEIKVYPNPTTSEINIELKTHSTDRHEIDIYSLLGQKINTVKTDKNNVLIDISDLTEGVYFIFITDGYDKRWTKKIIKNAPQNIRE